MDLEKNGTEKTIKITTEDTMVNITKEDIINGEKVRMNYKIALLLDFCNKLKVLLNNKLQMHLFLIIKQWTVNIKMMKMITIKEDITMNGNTTVREAKNSVCSLQESLLVLCFVALLEDVEEDVNLSEK